MGRPRIHDTPYNKRYRSILINKELKARLDEAVIKTGSKNLTALLELFLKNQDAKQSN